MSTHDPLPGLLAELSSRLSQLTTADVGGTTEYRRGGRAFACVSPNGVAEFRLHPEVADAARRTVDAGTSERGAEWVRFTPRQLDRHAADRAEAWFLSAWRAAKNAPT